MHARVHLEGTFWRLQACQRQSYNTLQAAAQPVQQPEAES